MKIVKPSVEIITNIDGNQILKSIELAARTCYKTEEKITEGPESAIKMIEKLIEMDHTAMLEFADVHVRIISDTGFLKDITRMRISSFAAESTRWCNYSKGKFNSELTFIEPINIKPDTPEYMIWYKTMKEIEESYMKMSQLGCKPDQMRMILPHSTKTEVNIKTNIREWRHIFGLRCHKAAHPSVRQVMLETLRLFHERIPVLFDDLYETFKEDILSNSL